MDIARDRHHRDHRRRVASIMNSVTSAGLLMYRRAKGTIECFIVHPGGPFWKNKDEGAWSIPKGEVEKGEELLETAQREFKEETGLTAHGPFIPLESVTLKSGKCIHAWAFEGDWLGILATSSYVIMEWPKGSGKKHRFPEVDKAGFFTTQIAKKKLNGTQTEFIDRLLEKLS